MYFTNSTEVSVLSEKLTIERIAVRSMPIKSSLSAIKS